MVDAILCDCDEPGCKGKLHSIRQCPMCKKDVEYWQIAMSLVGICLQCEEDYRDRVVRSAINAIRERERELEIKMIKVILGDTKLVRSE